MATKYHGRMGGPPGTYGKLLNCATEFNVCMETMHGYTVEHVSRDISGISSGMAGPKLQCEVTGSRQYNLVK